MSSLLSLLTFLSLCTAHANEPNLKQALSLVPGGKLSLEFVLKTAIKNSSSFQALKSTQIEADALKVGAEGQYDWVLLADYDHLDQDKDTLSPFEPGEIQKDNSSLGFRKSFTSGTSIETRWGTSRNSLLFNDPSIQIPSYYEDTLTFTLKQNLWSDFFGISSRASRRSEILAAQSLDHQDKLNQQIWALNLIETYHNAWLSQRMLAAAQESVQRRDRLAQVTQAKLKKGTSERQDFLQVQAAQFNSKNELSRASARLNETWRSLVILLDLPEAWLEIPPEKIPMTLTDISKQSFTSCSRSLEIEKTLEVQKAKANYESAKENLKAAESNNNPKLELVGGYNTNGIAVTQNRAQRENWGADHPSWNVGIRFEMPLGDSTNKSNRLRALSKELKAKTDFDSAIDDKVIEIKTLCEKLRNSETELKNSELAFKNQKERLELEERKFRFGRSSTFNVIQAGDDKTSSELNYNQSQIDFRTLSWKVLSATSELYELVQKWKTEL